MSEHIAQWWQVSAARIAEAYRLGEVSPVEVIASCLSRIDAVNPVLNAIISQRRDAVRAEAEASAARFARGQALGPLDGLPIVLKDNLLTRDLPTTWGSMALKDYQPELDEWVVERLRAGGALIIGKTNVPEFTLEGYTGNRLFGITRNPWNPALTPGGSSGGSVAAVAAGMVPLALGSDGGGSSRRPASHTGLVGLKPSIGAIARTATLPQLLLDLDVVGVIARTVADTRLLFNALRGPHPSDRRSQAAEHAAASLPALMRELRILYVPAIGNAPVDPQITTSCHAAAQRFTELGHFVEIGELPFDLSWMSNGWPVIGHVGLASMFSRHPEWRQASSQKYLDMAESGKGKDAVTLWQVLEDIEALRRRASAFFADMDLIITPTAAALPWPAEDVYPPLIAGQPVGPRGHAIFTAWVNAAGLPAIAVPAEPTSDGLPIGIQIIGDYGRDAALLDIADAYSAHSLLTRGMPLLS